MAETASTSASRPRWSELLGGLYVELVILIFCIAILSQTGKTSGPVYDVVGPDFLPAVVAYTVGGLALLQMVVHIFKWSRGREQVADQNPSERDGTRKGMLVALIFSGATIAYVGLLSVEVLPFWLLTFAFLLTATLLISRRLSWRNVLLGAGIGIVMGIGLQLIFTQLLFINLPV
jgi:hypothetical protein